MTNSLSSFAQGVDHHSLISEQESEMSGKKVLHIALESLIGIGERFLNLLSLSKGTSVILASNPLTQMCQSSWKYFANGVVHVYQASHTGAAGICRILFGWDTSKQITEHQRLSLLAGLLGSRMSPNRNSLVAALIWKSLSPADKTVLLKHAFGASQKSASIRKAHKALFDSLAEYAEEMTEQGPKSIKRKKASAVTFSTLGFIDKDVKKGGPGKRDMTVEDLPVIEQATQ